MTRTELQNKIRSILHRQDVTVRTRYAKTQVGECWGHFVALYGTFDVLADSALKDEKVVLHYDNESLAYAMNDKEIIDDLQRQGWNAFSVHRGGSRKSGRFEILIQVSCYYSSYEAEQNAGEQKEFDPKTRFYEFYDGAYPISKDQVGESYKYADFKIVNSF